MNSNLRKQQHKTGHGHSAVAPKGEKSFFTRITDALFSRRDNHPFALMGLRPELVKAVKAMLYEEPMPIQAQVIPLALSGADLMGCAQTGSGKTAAFVLPILHRMMAAPGHGVRALVLVPTRELALQVEYCVQELGAYTGFKTALVIGGANFERQLEAVAHGASFMVATPGRLLDHIRRNNFSVAGIEFLVLDEADRMLDMGFLPDITSIIRSLPKKRQTMLFSATLAPEIERVAAFALHNPKRIEIANPRMVASGITQTVYPVLPYQKNDLLCALLKTVPDGCVLIFCGMKTRAERLGQELKHKGFSADILHSDRSQSQRTRTMSDFRAGKIKILVATDVVSRGIDMHSITHVINYDVPHSPEDYVHRIGRTARAYGVGNAVTLLTYEDRTQFSAVETFVGEVFTRAALPGFKYDIPPKLTVEKTPLSAHWPKSRRR